MRNVILFLARYYLTIVFILLEVLCFALIISGNNYHQAGFYNQLQKVSGNAYDLLTSTKLYLKLPEINEKLAAENAYLRNQLPSALHLLSANQVEINDSVFQQAFIYRSATAINSSRFGSKNLITINRGYLQGIKPQQAVFNSNGIVGVTKDVSAHFATVVSVLNTEATYSVKLKNSNYFGLMRWDGKSIAQSVLYDIPSHVLVNVGDTVVTWSGSSIFPAELMVGTVAMVNILDDEPFLELKIDLSTDFSNLDYVTVAEHLLKSELDSLQTLSNGDK